jgi:ferredoxin
VVQSAYNPAMDDHANVPHPSSVEVDVDPDLCIGSGDCVRLVPEAFRLDEAAGVSMAIPSGVAGAGLERLIEAARGCPTQAIRVTHDGVVVHHSN